MSRQSRRTRHLWACGLLTLLGPAFTGPLRAQTPPATSAGLERVIAAAQADVNAGHDAQALARLRAALPVAPADARAWRKAAAGALSDWGNAILSSDAARPESGLHAADRLCAQGLASLRRPPPRPGVPGPPSSPALHSFRQALSLYQQGDDQAGESFALNGLGTASLGVHRPDLAAGFFRRARALRGRAGNRDAMVGLLESLVDADLGLGRYSEAFDCSEQALRVALKAIVNDRPTPRAYDPSRLGSAIGILRQAALLYKQAGERNDAAFAFGDAADACEQCGRFREAIGFQRQAAALFRADRGENAALALSSMGDDCRILGQSREAIRSYQQVIAPSRQSGASGIEADALDKIGDVYSEHGQYRPAVASFRRAIAVARQRGDRSGEVDARAGIARTRLARHQYRAALDFSRQTLAAFKKGEYEAMHRPVPDP